MLFALIALEKFSQTSTFLFLSLVVMMVMKVSSLYKCQNTEQNCSRTLRSLFLSASIFKRHRWLWATSASRRAGPVSFPNLLRRTVSSHRREQADRVRVLHQQSSGRLGVVGGASRLPEEAGRLLFTVESRQSV